MTSFTAIWKLKKFYDTQDFFSKPTPLDVIESNQFDRRGVTIGDFIYAVSRNDDGQLLLVGKMQVDKFVSSSEEVEIILGLPFNFEQYDGEKHEIVQYAIAKSGTLMQFDVVIPYEVTKNLSLFSTPPVGLKQ